MKRRKPQQLVGTWEPISLRPATAEELKEDPEIKFYWEGSRLPEIDGVYLVTLEGPMGRYVEIAEFDADFLIFDFVDEEQIVAWATLPKPY